MIWKLVIFCYSLVIGNWLLDIPLAAAAPRATWWSIQAIDTMKESRDLAREKANDKSFDSQIDKYVSRIASTGATHVAIGTPYDEEFVPYMRRWVQSARRHGLSVWFRGNFSGWEGWFDYPKITRADHLQKTKAFIMAHPDLFVDGDLFSACPECENGGPGDPRKTRDIRAYREFIISLYHVSKTAFTDIKIDVKSNLFSMNGDVAKLIMDPATTHALDKLVVVDHYVTDPNKLVADITALAKSSGGKVILGEFGAPIPDLHKNMTADQQAEWLKKVLLGLSAETNLVGLNYWTGFNSSTKLWENDLVARPAVAVLYDYFVPRQIIFTVKNVLDQPVAESIVTVAGRHYKSDKYGVIRVAIPDSQTQLQIDADSYNSRGVTIDHTSTFVEIVLDKTSENIFFKLRKLTYRILQSIISK